MERGGSYMHKLLSGLVAGVALLARGAARARRAGDRRPPDRGADAGRCSRARSRPTSARSGSPATPRRTAATGPPRPAAPSATPVPTRGAALAEAAERRRSRSHGDLVRRARQPDASTRSRARTSRFDPATAAFLAEYKNGDVRAGRGVRRPGRLRRPTCCSPTPTAASRCSRSPARRRPGPATTATVKVTDAASGAAVAGATVGGAVTGADGTATVGPFTQRGDQRPQGDQGRHGALQPAARVRERRRGRLLQHGGAGGPLGAGAAARDTTRAGRDDRARCATARSSPAAGRRGCCAARVAADPSGLRAVKLRLTRRRGRHCSVLLRAPRALRRMRCGRGSFLRIGDRADWSYLLPKRLGARPLRARGQGDRRRVQPRRRPRACASGCK